MVAESAIKLQTTHGNLDVFKTRDEQKRFAIARLHTGPGTSWWTPIQVLTRVKPVILYDEIRQAWPIQVTGAASLLSAVVCTENVVCNMLHVRTQQGQQG